MKNARHIADTLTQRAIAQRLGLGVTAVNNAVKRGVFPASWFPVVREMCREADIDCPETAFNFKTAGAA